MVRVVGSGIGHIVQHIIPTQLVSLGHGQQSLRAEGAFGVDVQTFAFGAAHINGQLTRDGQSVGQLRLSGAEFAEQFCDGSGLDSAAQQFVQLFGSGRHLNDLGPSQVHFGGRRESGGHEFLTLGDDLVGFGLGNAFDGQQVLFGRVDDGLDCVVAGLLELLDVPGRDAVLLQGRHGQRTQSVLFLLLINYTFIHSEYSDGSSF